LIFIDRDKEVNIHVIILNTYRNKREYTHCKETKSQAVAKEDVLQPIQSLFQY